MRLRDTEVTVNAIKTQLVAHTIARAGFWPAIQ